MKCIVGGRKKKKQKTKKKLLEVGPGRGHFVERVLFSVYLSVSPTLAGYLCTTLSGERAGRVEVDERSISLIKAWRGRVIVWGWRVRGIASELSEDVLRGNDIT